MNFDRLFEQAKIKGIEDIQISLNKSKKLEIEIYKSEIENYTIAEDIALSVKGIYQGKMGVYFTEIVDDSMIDTIVDNIIENAKIIDSNDEVEIYAGDEDYKEICLYDESMEKKPIKEKINSLLDLEKIITSKDERITLVETFYQEYDNSTLLQNSKGLKLEEKSNIAMLGGNIIVKSQDDQRSAFEYDMSNDFADFDLEKIATNVVDKATKLLGAMPIDSKDYEVVLSSDASAQLLSVYSRTFSSEAVQKGMSMLKDKIGQNIASDIVNIVDDPFMPKKIKSGSFDSEGVSTKYKEVVSNGKLNTYLYNLKTAKKDNVKSTGNGFSGSVGTTNFYIKQRTKTLEELYKDMESGFYVTDLQGTHSGANPISGDFSLQATGFLIEEGVLTKPVALVTVAGNYFKLLQDITDLDNNLKFSFSGVGSPAIRVKSLAVSGKEQK